jgi:transglutaminase-like putative cysteine protease
MTILMTRRTMLQGAAALTLVPSLTRAREFDPKPAAWRNFEVTTTVELLDAPADARVWVPVPSVNTHWQRSLKSETTTSAARTSIESDPMSGASYVIAEFQKGQPAQLQVISRIQTMNRSVDWHDAPAGPLDNDAKRWLRPTALVPTEGIVHTTAQQVTKGATTDLDKVRRIYDWVIASTYREPKTRGCGLGDIRWLLETGDMGGKCADINGLFVGLCRAAGVPARDAYGLRLAPSAFDYKELGSNPTNLKTAQHCRAEVYLRKYGWTAMDPADVDKVMRQETPEWIKDSEHPIVAPVKKALFGGWEGNWMAYSNAVDITLPGASGGPLPFLMYPQAQSGDKRYDAYDPDNFKYTISAREIKI